jgi:hypothetical protein
MTRLEARGRRSDYALAGVGFDGCCFPRSRLAPYVATRTRYSKVAWLFAHTGVGPGEPFGRIGGESDRSDPKLTPANHVVAAEALFRGRHGVVRAEMVVAKAHGGTVFAAGNYDFLRIRKRTPSGRRLPAVMLDNLWKRLVLGR